MPGELARVLLLVLCMKSPEARYRKLRRQALALAAKGMPGAAARLARRALRVFDHLSLCKQRLLRCRDLRVRERPRRADSQPK